ncbi:hypothetical protein P154DRAFT_522329 [Amniculicola lignicola CBS 123094]|uniref:Uncharacterized protein n=1 Tax=Amniculicola lignicola CBS 123094 TaxID=1392246 RepID=A0A6A5WGH9_9PLEO|nr:hypothetical protein P154DRAFT_522329 [Amniculicola lignicola CBS 123094]
MPPQPHSKTVRGTLSNPKRMAAVQTGRNPPQLCDPISLSTEKDDSIPLDSVPDFSKPADPYRQNETSSSTLEGGHAKDLPHSKTVRGTLGHSGEGAKTVNRSMLGDPVSLKAETSESEWGRGAGGEDESMQRVAEKRGEYQKEGRGSRL